MKRKSSNKSFNNKDRKDIHLELVKPGLSLGECFNLGMGLCSGQFIGKFDDDDLYGLYLDQMLPLNIRARICRKVAVSCIMKIEFNYLRFNNNRHKFSDLFGPTFLFKERLLKR